MNSSCFMICVLDSFYGNSKAFSCYSRKRFFRKGFEPEVHGNLTRLSFLSSRTQWNRKRFSPLRANMLFVSKNSSLEKVAFMNSSCFIICELNWIVFMAIVKHFRVKMRLAFFCCANLIKYKYTFCLVSLLFSLTSNGVVSLCNANGVLVHLMLFVSIKCFAGKGFCDMVCLCEL